MSKKIFALEELNEEEAIVVAPDNEEEARESESQVELESANAEVDDVNDQVDHAVEVASTLDNIGASLSVLKPEETIPEPAMEALHLAISGLLGSIGMASKQRGVALEGFKKSTTALESLESIKEVAKAIWAKIVAFFKSVVKAISEFINKMRLSNDALRKRAEKLVSAARTHRSDSVEAGAKIKSASLAKFLQTPDGVAEGSDFLPALKKHSVAIKVVQESTLKLGEEGIVSLEASLKAASLIGGGNMAEDFVNKAATPYVTHPDKYVTRNIEVSKRYSDHFIVREYPMVFGTSSMYVVLFNGSVLGADNPLTPSDLSKLTVFMDNTEAATQTEEVTAIPFIDIEQVAVEVLASTKAMAELVKVSTDIVKKLDAVASTAYTLATRGISIERSFNSASLNSIYAFGTAASRFVTNAIKNVQFYDMKVTKNALDYIQASLKLTTKAGGETVDEVKKTNVPQLAHSK